MTSMYTGSKTKINNKKKNRQRQENLFTEVAKINCFLFVELKKKFKKKEKIQAVITKKVSKLLIYMPTLELME